MQRWGGIGRRGIHQVLPDTPISGFSEGRERVWPGRKEGKILVWSSPSKAVFSFLDLELALANRNVCELRVLGSRKIPIGQMWCIWLRVCCECVCMVVIGFHPRNACQFTGDLGEQQKCAASVYCSTNNVNILQVCSEIEMGPKGIYIYIYIYIRILPVCIAMEQWQVCIVMQSYYRNQYVLGAELALLVAGKKCEHVCACFKHTLLKMM